MNTRVQLAFQRLLKENSVRPPPTLTPDRVYFSPVSGCFWCSGERKNKWRQNKHTKKALGRRCWSQIMVTDRRRWGANSDISKWTEGPGRPQTSHDFCFCFPEKRKKTKRKISSIYFSFLFLFTCLHWTLNERSEKYKEKQWRPPKPLAQREKAPTNAQKETTKI